MVEKPFSLAWCKSYRVQVDLGAIEADVDSVTTGIGRETDMQGLVNVADKVINKHEGLLQQVRDVARASTQQNVRVVVDRTGHACALGASANVNAVASIVVRASVVGSVKIEKLNREHMFVCTRRNTGCGRGGRGGGKTAAHLSNRKSQNRRKRTCQCSAARQTTSKPSAT